MSIASNSWHAARVSLSLAALLTVAVEPALAQVAVVEHNVNLRVDSSTGQEPIRLLTPGAEAQVLDNQQQVHGYYHVISAQGEEGWIWGRNVHIDANRTIQPPVEPLVFNGCPPEGNAIPEFVKSLNRLKNRYKAPQAADIDPNVTLQAILGPGTDEGRNSGHAAEISGYVYDVKVGGIETANCRATDKQYRDTHIEVTLASSDSGPRRRVVVEVTPRWRAMENSLGVDWSTDGLKARLKGHTVKFRGWMVFDAEHKGQSENTNQGGPTNWRATGWELHPVTSIEIVQ